MGRKATWMKPMCNCTWASRNDVQFFPLVFSLFWRENFFVGTHGSYHLFSFLPTQPNILKKVFLSIFSPKFFIHLISPPNKHTLRVFILFYFIFELSFCIIFFILSLFIIKVHVFHLLFLKKN